MLFYLQLFFTVYIKHWLHLHLVISTFED